MRETLEFEWDPAKAKANLRKHELTFPYATRVFLDPNRIERPDEGEDDEDRWRILGRVEEFVLVVICTFRSGRVRIISARRAIRNELIEYWDGQIPA
jgi:uncharacterized protein